MWAGRSPIVVADRGEAQVGIILAQQQAVLGAGGEHAVRLERALGDEVINEDADVGLVAGAGREVRGS